MGVVIGVIVALALGRVTSTLLFEVSSMDPTTYGAVAASLPGVAVVASYLPALRVTGIDPAKALRSEEVTPGGIHLRHNVLPR